MKFSLGLGKTIFNSGISLIPVENYHETQIVLSERIDRKKNSGAWPLQALRAQDILNKEIIGSAQNRDVQTIREFEDYLDSRYPFREHLKASGLSSFLDENCQTENHHLAHAYSATLYSPFEESLVLVIDGAGSKHPEGYEFLSLFEFSHQQFNLLDKKYTQFDQNGFSESIGLFYEAISEFIFNSKTLAGKVMGLAPLGKSFGKVSSYPSFLSSLDQTKKFTGKGKEEWEASPHMNYYQDLAATVQEAFEDYLFEYLKDVSRKFSHENLILVGGCALNCTFNGKLWKTKLFKNIYIPPNPGDEGISLGCAWSLIKDQVDWAPLSWNLQTSARGSIWHYDLKHIKKIFSSHYQIKELCIKEVAALLCQDECVAWYQGRSEVGPRALGQRSILSRPRRGVKSFLNAHVKFREAFRPYGCTLPQDEVATYFEVDKDFENPFMSFAIKVRDEYFYDLEDVCHIDQTSRFQTLHREQNARYYDLLKEVGQLTGKAILLNTSLNIMGEPILETIEDAYRFMENSVIRYLVFNDYLIIKDQLHV